MGGELMTVDLKSSPSQTGKLLAVSGSSLTLTVTVMADTRIGLILCVAGLAIFFRGVLVGSRREITVGCLVLYGSILVASMFGVGSVATTIGAIGVVSAWDSAENSVILQRQLSREAKTRRAELVHVATTASVITAAAVVSHLVYFSVASSRPTVILVILLIGTLLLMGALNQRE